MQIDDTIFGYDFVILKMIDTSRQLSEFTSYASQYNS
jgi:hypothetical protein